MGHKSTAQSCIGQKRPSSLTSCFPDWSSPSSAGFQCCLARIRSTPPSNSIYQPSFPSRVPFSPKLETHRVCCPIELRNGDITGLLVSVRDPDRMDTPVQQGQSGAQECSGQNYTYTRIPTTTSVSIHPTTDPSCNYNSPHPPTHRAAKCTYQQPPSSHPQSHHPDSY